MDIVNFCSAHTTEILTALFFISEALSVIPGVKANGIFQLIVGWLSRKQPAAVPPAPPAPPVA